MAHHKHQMRPCSANIKLSSPVWPEGRSLLRLKQKVQKQLRDGQGKLALQKNTSMRREAFACKVISMGTEVLLSKPRTPFAAESGCRGHASLSPPRWDFLVQGLRCSLAPAGFDIVHPLSVAWCAPSLCRLCLWLADTPRVGP